MICTHVVKNLKGFWYFCSFYEKVKSRKLRKKCRPNLTGDSVSLHVIVFEWFCKIGSYYFLVAICSLCLIQQEPTLTKYSRLDEIASFKITACIGLSTVLVIGTHFTPPDSCIVYWMENQSPLSYIIYISQAWISTHIPFLIFLLYFNILLVLDSAIVSLR